MKKYDTTILKSIFYENWHFLVIGILIFFLLKSCQKNSDTELAIITQKEATKEFLDNSELFLHKVDSLKIIASNFKKEIALAKADSINKAKEIQYLKNVVKDQLKKISLYSTTDIARSYQQRYNAKKEVVVTQYGVALSNNVAKQNLSELAVCDETKGTLQVVQKDLTKQKGIIKDQDKYIVVTDQMNTNLNFAITEQGKAINSQKETIKTAEKQFKTERNKKNFWKVATGTVLIGAGYFFIAK